ncbi:MAG: hypothetical protein AAGL24_08755 [Pseudomonadota bacterium]
MYKLLSKVMGVTAIAAMLSLGGVATSSAVTVFIDPGDNNVLTTGVSFLTGDEDRNGAFSDTYFFSLPDTGANGAESVQYSFDVTFADPTGSNFGIADLVVTLFDATNLAVLDSVTVTDGSGIATGLASTLITSVFPAPINLELIISGTALSAGGSYNAFISAVPLPPALLMLVSAFIGLGFLSRRRARVAA